jgi:hypothetical protein
MRAVDRIRALRRRRPGGLRAGTAADLAHLEEFLRSRLGVQAFVEPRTAVTDTTVLLVAHDGEWTRRRVDGPSGAETFARRHNVPLLDAAVVGYPQRMRDFNARRAGGAG